MSMIPVIAKTCRRCRKTYAFQHFKRGRKTCETCLRGAPTPAVTGQLSDGTPVHGEVVIKRPRSTRRWWPRFVRSKTEDGSSLCRICDKPCSRRYCSPACQSLRRNVERNRAIVLARVGDVIPPKKCRCSRCGRVWSVSEAFVWRGEVLCADKAWCEK